MPKALLTCAVLVSLTALTGVVAFVSVNPATAAPMAISGKSSTAPSAPVVLDRIASDYVDLCLEIDRIDPGFVDSYIGEPEIKRRVAQRAISTPQVLRKRAETLATELRDLGPTPADLRTQSLLKQLGAAETRLRLISGERVPFDDQLRALFDLAPPRPFQSQDYEPVLAQLDRLLPPGPGGLAARLDAFHDRYTIRPERVKACADTIVADLRSMGRSMLRLPIDEEIDEVRLVTGTSWSAYNWYLGHGHSRVEVNRDLPLRAHSLVATLAHETYFGHHAEMTLREAELYRGRGWVEYSVYPLYSPQGVISEGAANAGIKVLLDDETLGLWLARRVFPSAGLPAALSEPEEIARLLEIERIQEQLMGLGCQFAELQLERGATVDSVVSLRQRFALQTREQARRSIRFARDYGGYACTYGMGERLVRAACD
ncbi:MAG: hypothetical protein ACREOU_11920, partial [Candidatus Eiseniibacteriota bacterium]